MACATPGGVHQEGQFAWSLLRAIERLSIHFVCGTGRPPWGCILRISSRPVIEWTDAS